MQVGAVGAYSYTPYIYNTNTVNRASLNKISGIGEDLLDTKTDFGALTSQETTNPLKRGESLDFAGIIGMQMQMSRMNASRVMTEPKKAEEITQAAGVNESMSSAQETANVDAAISAQPVSSGSVESMTPVASTENAQQGASIFDYAKAMAAYQPIDLFA